MNIETGTTGVLMKKTQPTDAVFFIMKNANVNNFRFEFFICLFKMDIVLLTL